MRSWSLNWVVLKRLHCDYHHNWSWSWQCPLGDLQSTAQKVPLPREFFNFPGCNCSSWLSPDRQNQDQDHQCIDNCIMGARRTFQQSIPSGLRGHQEVFFSNCFKDGTKKKHLKQRKSFEISLVSFFRKTGHPHIHWYQNYRTILIKIMIDPPCQDPHTMCWRSWVWWCQILFQFSICASKEKAVGCNSSTTALGFHNAQWRIAKIVKHDKTGKCGKCGK